MTLATEEEHSFARAMLAEPHDSRHRLVYADWLEERGDVGRAALVREAEGWHFTLSGFHAGCDLGLSPEFTLFSVVAGAFPIRDDRHVALIYRWTARGRWTASLRIRPDGSSPDSPHNWAWLLSLAMSRGLVILGLSIPPRP